jgi:hypothetical protein
VAKYPDLDPGVPAAGPAKRSGGGSRGECWTAELGLKAKDLVVLGFVGVAIRKNNAQPAEDNLEQKADPPEERAQLRSRLTEGPEEFHLPKAKGKL